MEHILIEKIYVYEENFKSKNFQFFVKNTICM